MLHEGGDLYKECGIVGSHSSRVSRSCVVSFILLPFNLIFFTLVI